MVDGASRTRIVGDSLAARSMLGLHVIVLAIGVLQFAFAPNSVAFPLLAFAALAGSALVLLLVRVVPALKRRPAYQHVLEIASMIVAITMLAIATGATRSALIPLYLVPLAAVAIAFGRSSWVLVTGAIVAALAIFLGSLTSGVDIGDPEFGVMLVSLLAPGVTVALLLAALVERMQEAVQKIRDLASTDGLTGLLNLRAFENILQQEHRKAERLGRGYSLILVDVDNLAHINETLGHDAGSLVLGAVASAVTRSVRTSDVAARLGGDEFIVLAIESDPKIAAAIAQRIRNNVYAGTVSVANRLIRANVSVGVASYPSDHLYPKELMLLADKRMQQDRELRREPGA